jgi:surface antigen
MRAWTKIVIVGGVLSAAYCTYLGVTRINLNPSRNVGEIVDSLDGVAVYFNGGVGHISGRNLTADGYNLGIKYQCVEFVKRYYFQHFNHRMPETHGNAVDFFDPNIGDGEVNKARSLVQFRNGSRSAPRAGDILVFNRWILNPYGHVAIVVRVDDKEIEIIQQNGGPFSSPREKLGLRFEGGYWSIASARVLGWLRLA